MKELLIMFVVGNLTTSAVYFGTGSWTLTLMYALLLAVIRFRWRLFEVVKSLGVSGGQ